VFHFGESLARLLGLAQDRLDFGVRLTPLDIKAGTNNDGCGSVSGGGRKLVLLMIALTTFQRSDKSASL
jgi:hypothetical protein